MPSFSESNPHRVAVTALGVISPLGLGAAENAAALRAGRDGVREVTAFDVSKTRSKTAGQVEGGTWRMEDGKSRALHPASGMMTAAAHEVVAGDACFVPELAVIGTTSGGMSFGEQYFRAQIEKQRARARAFWLANYMPQKAVLDALADRGWNAPSHIIANACASGSNAIGHAFRLVRAGKYRRVLCGGYDAL